MEFPETDPLLPRSSGRPPRDRGYIVYIIFYLLGVGSLLPWNFFSNARQYFMFKLRNVSATNETDFNDPELLTGLQEMFESYLTVAAMVPNILFMFLNTAATKLISLRVRILVAMFTMIIMFALTIALVEIDTNSWQSRFFAVTLVSIVIMNAGSAVLQGGMFGLSSLFPKAYTQSVMGGMGLGGTVAAVSNIACLALGSSQEASAFGFFMTAEITLFIALAGYLCLPLLNFAKYHQDSESRKNSVAVNGSLSTSATSGEIGEKLIADSSASAKVPLLYVFKKIWKFALCIFLIFFVTLSCYPAVNSAILPMSKEKNAWTETYFAPVTCFLLFNVFDLVGRTTAGFFMWPREEGFMLPLLCVLRVAFIPIFLFSNVSPRAEHLPVVFNTDWVPIFGMVFFAFTNGHLGTLCMMYGPRKVILEDIETAGSMMSFFLSLGLGLGSLFSLLILLMIKL